MSDLRRSVALNGFVMVDTTYFFSKKRKFYLILVLQGSNLRVFVHL
jgi:hypothetical protein